MPVDAVSSTAKASGAASDARLARGAVLDARVTSVGNDGTVRIATAFGSADLATDVPLEPGQAVRLVVQNAAAGLTLAFLTDETGAQQAPQQPAAPATPGPAQAPAILRAVAEVMQRSGPSAAGMTALFANLPTLLKGETAGLPTAAVQPAVDVLTHALSAEKPVTAQAVKAAITGSGVFREARLASGQPAAAQPAADLKSALIAFRTVLGSVVEAFDTVRASGQPAAPANTARSGAAAAGVSDAKDVLQSAKSQTPPQRPGNGAPPVPSTVRDAALPPAPPTAAAAGTAAEATQGATPTPAPPAPGGADAAPQNATLDTAAATQARPPAATLPPASSGVRPADDPSPSPAEPRALPPAIAAAVANLPEPGRSQLVRLLTRTLSGEAPDNASVREILLKAGVVGDTALASRGPDERPDRAMLGRYADAAMRAAGPDARSSQTSPPPRADAPPRPEPSSVATLSNDSGTAETVRLLLRETDQAIDRTLLNQYASLPRDAGTPGAPQGQHAQAWVMDVPVLIGREATAAQMRITRDGGGQGSSSQNDPPRWSVDFALDSMALGPVHAHVRLIGDGVGVTMWAERPDTAQTLKDSSAQLRRSLSDAALAVDEVDFHLGAPVRPAAPKGYLVDTQS
jgi:hypothetical protein